MTLKYLKMLLKRILITCLHQLELNVSSQIFLDLEGVHLHAVSFLKRTALAMTVNWLPLYSCKQAHFISLQYLLFSNCKTSVRVPGGK